MINASELLTSIKMDLGIHGLKLPFENPDKEILNVLRKRTLKTFSTYLPQIQTISLDLAKDLECIKEEYTESIYILPDLFDREILYVRNIFLKTKLLGNGFIAPVFDGSIDTYNSMMLTQTSANLASVAAPAITFKFDPPNKLTLYNIATAYGMIDIELALEHADNFATISQTSWDSFYELALLDVKRFLYGIMKHYTELSSAYGTVNLKIDDWQNAESERKDLIERWKDVAHLETEQFFII